MATSWQAYQDEADDFFRSLGFTADVNARKVKGVRGEHDVDVLVTGAVYGLPFTWVVECKDWSSNVPKEKVMVLLSICQDLGADRGYLLSEKDFRAGAVRAARTTNVVLTSLADLREATNDEVQEAAIIRMQQQILLLWQKFVTVPPETAFPDDPAGLQVRLFSFDDAALRLLSGQSPAMHCWMVGKDEVRIEIKEELLRFGAELIKDARECFAACEPPIS